MSNFFWFFLAGSIGIFIISQLANAIFLPSDILYLFPSFSQNDWKAPQNSLLIDPLIQFEPWRQYAKERMLQGEFPLWNNLNGKGAPFFANPQTAVLYPLNIVYYALPTTTALYATAFLKLGIFALGTYLYLKVLNLSSYIAFLGSVAAASSGFVVVWLSWPHTNVFILLPFVLLVTEKIIAVKKEILHRWYSALILCYFIASLGGHPETLFHLGLIHSLYALIRLKGIKKKLIGIVGCIVSGVMLAGIQIVPFLEYVFLSNAISIRSSETDLLFLPWQSFIFTIIPFLLGAPHLEFYRSISDKTNFQETIGGYIGPSLFLLALFGMWYLRKKEKGFAWSSVVIVCFLIAYKIWPFWLITQLPLLNGISNSRLVGFSGFGLLVLSMMVLNTLLKKRVTKPLPYRKIIMNIVFVGMAFLIGYVLLIPMNYLRLDGKIYAFVSFLYFHIVFLLTTTGLFFAVVYLIRKHQRLSPAIRMIVLVLVVSQTAFLLWNYNPTTKKAQYYPQTELIQHLKRLEPGTILETGNINFPPNINLIYGISHAENDDALQVREYKKSFDRAFPIKNHWAKVEQFDLSHVRKFGIRYIISDYDINLKRQILQPRYEDIFPLDSSVKHFDTPFLGSSGILKAIRILPANYNRVNTCTLTVSLLESENQELAKQRMSCKDIRDKMFFTVDFPDIQLTHGKKYTLQFTSPNGSKLNSIGLWGVNQQPYVELLFKQNLPPGYNLRYHNKTVLLFEVPEISDIHFQGFYKVLVKKPEKLVLELAASNNSLLALKQPYYPGWVVTVDGRTTKIMNTHPFITVSVPKGKHTLMLEYKPFSLVLGSVVSLGTFLIVFVYGFRSEKKLEWFKRFSI